MQIGDDWQDKLGDRVWSITLPLNGEIFARGCIGRKVILWDIEMWKVINQWKGSLLLHTQSAGVQIVSK